MNSGDTRTAYLLLYRPLVEGLFLLIILPQTLRLNVALLISIQTFNFLGVTKASQPAAGRH